MLAAKKVSSRSLQHLLQDAIDARLQAHRVHVDSHKALLKGYTACTCDSSI